MKKFIILLCSLLALGLVSCAVVVPDTEDTDTGEAITSLEPKTPKSHDPIIEAPSDETETSTDEITGSSTNTDKMTDLLSGIWDDSYGTSYWINSTVTHADGSVGYNETHCSYKGIIQYNGTSTTICFDVDSDTAGYIYIKIEYATSSLYSYLDIGKWYAIRFKDLSETSVMLSEAYGAKSSTNTLEEAKAEFTVDNGYFTVYSIYEKLN